MIRYKEIFLGNQCNNNCLHCLFRQKDPVKPELQAVINALEQAKGDSVALYGGEPTLRNDLLGIILAAKRKGFRRIKLITNGCAFSDIQFLLEIANAGCYLFEIKVWGPNPDIHDYLTQTTGSFWQTIQGIENLQRLSCDKFICVRIPLCCQNYKDLEATVTTALGLGINRIILQVQDYHLSLEDVLPHIKNAVNLSILNRVWIVTEGLPFCIMQGLEHHISEIYYGWDTLFEKVFKHHQYCQDCIYQELCPGVEEKYLEQFGNNELSPVKENKYLQDILAFHG